MFLFVIFLGVIVITVMLRNVIFIRRKKDIVPSMPIWMHQIR